MFGDVQPPFKIRYSMFGDVQPPLHYSWERFSLTFELSMGEDPVALLRSRTKLDIF